MRVGRFWGLGSVGFVVAAYGCGSSSNNDQNEPPIHHASGGHGAGAAGRGGASASGNGGVASVGKAGAGATGGASAGRGGAGAGGSSGQAEGAGKGGTGGASGTAGKGGAGKGGAGTGGTATNGGEAGATSGAGGEGGSLACDPNDTSVPFKKRCLACAQDACGTCLCNDCTSKLQTCQETPGCQDIANCVIAAGCTSEACYCGSFALAECLAGQSDGPCKDVILNAPGGHEPSLVQPSAGPASDAAIDVGLCAISGGPCATDCP
jgi:hypothetical protein